MSNPDLQLRPGEPTPGEVHGGCQLERLLGRGGMGAVYAARASNGQPVVVKFLDPGMAKQPVLRERFHREWDAMRKLRPHPNLVRVHEVHASAQQPCIVMELVQGTNLEEALSQGGKLEPRKVVEVGRGIALALAIVHAHGLIHRDIKPGNIILTPEGQAKLIDFGLAKDLFLSGLTKPGQLLGTAHYMAPEQWEDEGVDARCDIFSLGATLYHLLTGSPPFDGEDMDEVADMCTSGDYPPLSEVVPGIPPDLELALAQMMMVDLRFRYGRMEEVAEDFERLLARQPVSAPALVLEGGQRLPLIPAEFFTLGSDPKCALVLDHPSVAAKHAQVRRQPTGFVLRDMKSPSGTFVGDERVAPGRGRPLQDGDRLRLGDVPVLFQDPRGGQRVASHMSDVEREQLPEAELQTLATSGDPRCVLALIERLAPDRFADAADDRTLAALGPQGLAAVRERRLAAQQRAASWAAERLAAITGVTTSADPAEWLAWWHQVRTTAPPQAGTQRPRRALRLRVTQGARLELPLGKDTVIFVGRDEKCQLRLELPEVPRLHATILRLHHRLAVLDGGSSAGTQLNGNPIRAAFLEPGDTLIMGRVHLVLDAAPPEPTGAVEPMTYQALGELNLLGRVAGLHPYA